jgi:hypothetical protein
MSHLSAAFAVLSQSRKLFELVTYLAYILRVTRLNLGQDDDYLNGFHGFLLSLQENAGILIKLSHEYAP